jgi:predicted nuclease with TOPRIM domain
MAKIRLHLGNLNIAELVALGRRVRAAMRDNSSFAPLRSQVACLSDEIDELMSRNESYKAALLLVQERLTEQQAQRIRLENLLTELANGVEVISGANAEMMESAGFDLPMVIMPPNAPRTPQKMTVEMDGAAVTR